MAWIICAAKNNLHRNHKRSGFISAVMLCLLSKGNTVWPNCFFPESPESIHQKMALVNFSLHTLKSKKQNSKCLCFVVFLYITVLGSSGGARSTQHQHPLCMTQPLHHQKRQLCFALLCSCSLLESAGPLWDQERTVKIIYAHLLQEGSPWEGLSAPFE